MCARKRPGDRAAAPRGHAAKAPHLVQCTVDVLHRGRHPRQQQFAGFGERNAPGGAVQKPDAEPLLQATKALAQA